MSLSILGEAGAGIISANLRNSDSAAINPLLPGVRYLQMINCIAHVSKSHVTQLLYFILNFYLLDYYNYLYYFYLYFYLYYYLYYYNYYYLYYYNYYYNYLYYFYLYFYLYY